MTTEPATAPVTIVVAGNGADAAATACALRSIEGAHVETTTLSGDDLLASLSRPDVDAIAFAGRIPDVPGVLRRALLAGRHGFVATPAAIASKQLTALDELARRRRRVLLFDDGSAHDERVAFIRRMTAGPNALWRPRYVRVLRTGAHGGAVLDEIAVCEIARVLAVMGSLPTGVAAFAPRIADEDGADDVALLTLAFDGGAAARIDISLTEPTLADELTVACDGRTVRLDAFDLRAPLQIHAGANYQGPQSHGQWAETISEHPLSGLGDQATRAARAFVQAVRANDLAASNAHSLAEAALVWETARASIASGGELMPVTAATTVATHRPELQLIRGGGNRVESAHAPELTLVRRTANARGRISGFDDGPRSA